MSCKSNKKNKQFIIIKKNLVLTSFVSFEPYFEIVVYRQKHKL